MDPEYFREKAKRCRLHAAVAPRRETKEQLRLWAREFDEIADEIDAAEERDWRAPLGSRLH